MFPCFQNFARTHFQYVRISETRPHFMQLSFAQIPSYEVGICPRTTLELIPKAKLSIEGICKKKDQKESLRQELALGGASRSRVVAHIVGGGESDNFSSPSTMPSTTSPFFV